MPTPRAEEVLSVHLRVPSLSSRRLRCTGSDAYLVHGHSGYDLFLGGKVTDSFLISAVAQAGLRVPTPRAEEVLSVHLRVPSLSSRRLRCTGSDAYLVHGHSGYAGLRDR